MKVSVLTQYLCQCQHILCGKQWVAIEIPAVHEKLACPYCGFENTIDEIARD